MTNNTIRLSEEALGGLSAGILGTLIGFPLDTLKTRMQTGGASKSLSATASTLLRNEGVLALYRGVAAPLVSLSLLNTINFTSYSFLKETLLGSGVGSGWDVRHAVAGAACGPLASSISTIENLVKTQMQVQKTVRFSSSWACLQQLMRGGVSTLYTGHLINTAREATFLGTYFWVYEGLRYTWVEENSSTTTAATTAVWAIPAAGGIAGAVSWTVSFPLDCVRAGVQGQDLHSSHRKAAHTVLRELLQTKGIAGLYAGVVPSILRAFLVSSSRFSAYEGALWLLRGGRNHDSHTSP